MYLRCIYNATTYLYSEAGYFSSTEADDFDYFSLNSNVIYVTYFSQQLVDEV